MTLAGCWQTILEKISSSWSRGLASKMLHPGCNIFCLSLALLLPAEACNTKQNQPIGANYGSI
jgi:hypothetical protein